MNQEPKAGEKPAFDLAAISTQLINDWLKKTHGLPVTLQLAKLSFAVIEGLEKAFSLGQSGTELKTIHNCWRIYVSQPLENGSLLSELGRPQDWGDPKWMYRMYVIEAQGYRNIVHCWADMPMKDHEHLQLFSSLITQIILPGWPEKRSTKDYLWEDDFWDKSWGKRPPFAEPDDED